jgi:hypothetical protein
MGEAHTIGLRDVGDMDASAPKCPARLSGPERGSLCFLEKMLAAVDRHPNFAAEGLKSSSQVAWSGTKLQREKR